LIYINHTANLLTQVVIGALTAPFTAANILGAGSVAIAISEIAADVGAAVIPAGTHDWAAAVFGGNTYIVEETTAHTFDNFSTIVELTGVHTVGNSGTAGAFTVLS
jgi:hypothetical protein